MIEIDADGSIKAKTDGYKGEICMKALQDLLGKDEFFVSVKPSDEFYQETQVTETNKIKAGRD